MAARTSSKKIFENEKYMDDVVSSIFSNLHKAAKKKNDYIWSLNKFSAMDSIWGAPDSDKSDDANTFPQELNSECRSSDSGNATPQTNKMHGKHPEDRQRSNASESGKTTSHRNIRSSFDPNVLVTEDSKSVNFEELSLNQKPGNSNQATETLGGSSVSNVAPKASKTFRNNYSFDTTEADSKVYEKNHTISEETPNHKQRYVDSKMKVTGNVKYFQQEELRKRTRHSSSGSTTSSNLASQRKLPKRTGFEESNSRCTVPKMILSVKIVQEDHYSEFIIKNSDFNLMMNKLPKIKEVFPDIDAGEKVIDFPAEAVKIVLG